MIYLIGYFLISFISTIYVVYQLTLDEDVDQDLGTKTIILNFFIWPLITPTFIGHYLAKKVKK
jgi:hypothetical protein